MKQAATILLIFLSSLTACRDGSTYQPEGLRKLSDTEVIEGALAGKFISDKPVFKDTMGNIIPLEEIHTIDQEECYGDKYVNDNHELVEVVIRRATKHDKELIQKIKMAFEEGEPITLINIDCSKTKSILETVYETDQGNRLGGSVENMNNDKENQQIVVSIIENCGFPTVGKHGSKSVETVFLVIQHAGKSLREKYFPLIKESADLGDLLWSRVALMEDRMLMDRGEKQKYGSQVRKEQGSDEWVLYPVEDPENVNIRRAEVGLGPIEEYLGNFGIDYKADK